MQGVFLMCSDNWIESISSDCYNFWHSSKTMERVNYRMVEEDSWDFDCLTIDMKHNHFQIAFYRCFPMCHRGPSQCVSGSPRKRYRIALDSAHSGGNAFSLQGITGKWKAVLHASLKLPQYSLWNLQFHTVFRTITVGNVLSYRKQKKQKQGERRAFWSCGKILRERWKVQFILQKSYLRILGNLEFGKNLVHFLLQMMQKCKRNKGFW